jgi:hypothetical protein
MKPSHTLWLIFAAAFLPLWLAACNAAPPAPLPTVTAVSGDTVVIVQSGGDERLRELATRLLTPRAFSVEDLASYQTPQLIVGGLPDGLPLDLPMPDDATLLGSMTQRSKWEGVTVLLDVSLPKEKVTEFYTQELGKQGFSGWERPFPNDPPGLANLIGSGTSMSTGKATYSNELYTALSVKDIAAHYNAQIEDAGWKLIGQDEDELVARSSWSLTDKFDGEWAGVLLVTAGPLEWSSRYVIFQIELK